MKTGGINKANRQKLKYVVFICLLNFPPPKNISFPPSQEFRIGGLEASRVARAY